MIKKYRNIILTNASIVGFSLNNVKAAETTNGKLSIKIDNKDYTLEAKKIDNVTTIKDIDGLLKALETAKKDIKDKDNQQVQGAITKDLYFVKSIQPGEGCDAKEFQMDDNFAIKLAAAKEANIELVSKRKCIDFEYSGEKRLKKDAEDFLLYTVIQGKALSTITDTGVLGADFGNSTLDGKKVKDGTEIIGKEVKVLDETNKIKFKIDSDKIDEGNFKTVVCKFADGVESNLVAGVDLDKYVIIDLDKDKLKTTDIITKLNKIDLLSDNKGENFFKNDAKFKAFKDGTGVPLESTNSAGADFSGAKFIVLSDIKEADINPVFLKKTFKVELDKEGNNDKKVESNILETIENNLKTKLGDKVVITVQQIIENIKSISDAGTIFKSSPFANLDNVTIIGVNTIANAKLKNEDTVNSAKIKISIKAAEFAAGIVKTEFTITYDNFDNKDVNGKKVKQTVINAIKGIIDSTTSKITKAEFIKKFNDATAIARSSDFAETDFGFLEIESGSDIVKSGKIDIKEGFWSKLKDECFDAPAKPKGGDKSNGSGDPKGDEKPKKRCCNSNK
jgi:hypothetical protein